MVKETLDKPKKKSESNISNYKKIITSNPVNKGTTPFQNFLDKISKLENIEAKKTYEELIKYQC
tara:strand:- start:577 stop:768 length:192 start_codon:yes stop_codon:yes gene_type:complete